MPDAWECAHLVDAVAEALILADVTDSGSLNEIERPAKALARFGRSRKTEWAREAAALAADAARFAAHPDASAGLEHLSARLAELQSLVASRPCMSASPTGPSETNSGPAPEARASASGAVATALAGDHELLSDFVARASEHLESADIALLALERDPTDAEALNEVFRAFHTIKGMAGFLALAEIEKLSHDTETILDRPRKGAGPLDPAAFDGVFRAVDAMKELVAHVLAPERSQGPPLFPTPAASSPRAPSGGTGTVRVDEKRLDRLLETVGELVIAESALSDDARSESGMLRFATQLGRLDKITRELQEMSTSLRMVPLRSTFVRMARVVRDTARRADKAVEFSTSGDETELDKMVVDRISDPLIHLLRNAVDHGIEAPDRREATGKPRAGRVQLRAQHLSGRIHIEVWDDGKGLDYSAIAASARRRGLVPADVELDKADLTNLVFAPGLSTAEKVSDVSGRGVGMDVVRKTIESLRGDIDVMSEPGRGTRVSIRLPLTLAIIDGMVVRVGAERYIIPTVSIERSLRPEADRLTSVMGRGRVIKVGDELVPLVSLGTLFEVRGAAADPTDGIVVVLSDNGDRVGVTADEILGQQQAVIKPLGEGLLDVAGVAGGAIMPDGEVGLILDVGGLMRLAREQEVQRVWLNT
jgi:two-component system chemotaxis sensor kinase CheA